MRYSSSSSLLVPRMALAISLILLLSVTACGSKQVDPNPETPIDPPATAVARPVDQVKILVDRPGLYRVTADQLAVAGFDWQASRTQGLVLTQGGSPVSFLAEEEGVIFYGQPRQSRYGQTNAYWLSKQGQPQGEGSAASGRTVAPVTGTPARVAQHQVRLEESHFYLSQTPQDTDHWLWQPIYAPDTFELSFDLPGWSGGDARLRLSLWANTEGGENPDHHVILHVNGQPVADTSWDGKGWQTIDADLPAAALQATDNRLEIHSPDDTGAVVDVIYVDWMAVNYARLLQAQEGRLQFSVQDNQPVAVAGFQEGELLLWDVTDPLAAQPLEGFQQATDPEGTLLQFQDSGAGAEGVYVATRRDALLTPLDIVPYVGYDLRDNSTGADYIAIVYPGFQQALQPLLDLRRSQGLRVAVASIDAVYDSFSYGLPDPAAIRDFMRYARDNWPAPAPRFLLLVGDASYDYQGFLAGSTANFVPTFLLTTHYVGETASDNWFVSLNPEDDLPDMAVGRIPAQTAQEVATAVAKTLAYESATQDSSWIGRALFVADDKQQEFQAISDDLVADYLPDRYQVQKVYLGQSEDPSADILNGLRQGVGLVNYVGHGSLNVWAQEKIFQVDDIASLDNATALPFMTTLTCLVGYFHHPQVTSMGEQLLFKQDGGVVAALVPTSESLASDQRLLAQNLYQNLFGSAPTVGEAIMMAKQDLPSEREIMQDLIETFTLLGDPALTLRKPAD